jgi:hypothetical protein
MTAEISPPRIKRYSCPDRHVALTEASALARVLLDSMNEHFEASVPNTIREAWSRVSYMLVERLEPLPQEDK